MDIINQLIETRDKTLPYFNLQGEALNKRYAPGKWSVRELLHHIADAESVLYERIRRVISEEKPVLWGFDPDGWCKNLEYSTQGLEINKAIFIAVREGVINLAEKNYQSKGSKEFVHNETGLRTLKDEIDKVAKHNAHHLAQIEKAINA